MLIKYSQTDKKAKLNAICKQQRSAVMKGPSGGCVGTRPHRKTIKGGSTNTGGPVASKRALAQKRLPSVGSGSIIVSRRRSDEARLVGGGIVGALDPCDNSNDSGLGFDHPSEIQKVHSTSHAHSTTSHLLHFDGHEESWDNHCPEVKRQRLGIKMEKVDEGSGDCFSVFSVGSRSSSQGVGMRPQTETVTSVVSSTSIRPVTQARAVPTPSKSQAHKRKVSQGSGPGSSGALASSMLLPPRGADGNYPLISQLPSNMLIKNESGPPTVAQLLILAQPESQHRARYQTEGSRGAVKDRSGNGFPIVKLVGFNGPAKLQVFIGTDLGRVAPHMFYQACRVSGKNSTPCSELKVDGTVLIEVDFDPAKDMVITCDCVGILKERNVDVEHRFPEQSAGRSKKKSTRCRMVFRANLKLPNGTTETLQAISQPIVCTQPPGVPEICKKSLTGCGCGGGAELFILGKNFLKDTRVVFRMGRDATHDGDDGGAASAEEEEDDTGDPFWEEQVIPDREFLQPTHLVCVVPPYPRRDITCPIQVRLLVTSSGKKSEAHTFTYTPEILGAQPLPQVSMSKTVVCHRGSGVTTATPPTTPLASPIKIAPAIPNLGAVTSTAMVLPAETTGEGLCESKMAVTLIAPTLGNTVTMSSQHPEHMHTSIPLSVEVNQHFAKAEPVELPISTPIVSKPSAPSAGASVLPTLGTSYISCPTVPDSQIPGAKEGVHPVVLWSTEGSTGTEVIKVLSGPLKLPSITAPSNPGVHLPLQESLSAQRSNQKEAEEVNHASLTSASAAENIPKTQGNLMVSSSSEASLIQQFVSNNISSPLPAQSGQSVEKFLSRLEGEQKLLLSTNVKVEANQPLANGELSLKTSGPTNIGNVSVSPSSIALTLPSNIAMQFASMIQTQPMEQKLVVDERADSAPSDSSSAVSPHRLVIDSLNHTLSEVLSEPPPSQPNPNSSTKENPSDQVTSPSSTPCRLNFVKPDQGLSDMPITTNMCSHSIGSTMPVSSAKMCTKEELGMCGMSLVPALSSNPISSEVANNNMSETIDQNCILGMQDPSISMSVPIQTTCTMTSADDLVAALGNGPLGTSPQQTMSQAISQMNLEHGSSMPIVTSPAMMHEVLSAPSAPTTQKESIAELEHSCPAITTSGTMSINVANAVASADMVPRLEHSMTVQTNDLQIDQSLVSNSCPPGSAHSNESIGMQCPNLSIDNHVEAISTSQMGVCQNMIQTVGKAQCSSESIPLASVGFPVHRMPIHPLARKDIDDKQRAHNQRAVMERVLKEEIIAPARILTAEANVTSSQPGAQPQLQLAVTVGPRKCGEDGGMVPQELTQMSDHDLLSYINPSCFDQV